MPAHATSISRSFSSRDQDAMRFSESGAIMISSSVAWRPLAYCAATMTPAPFRAIHEGTGRAGGRQNLPANCQAQDISTYRFPLMRATARQPVHGREDKKNARGKR